MKIKMRNKIYEFKYGNPGKYFFGICDYDRKRITVRKSLHTKLLIDVIIHECLHSCCKDLTEEAVTETSTSIARLLIKLGLVKDLYVKKK